MASKKRTPKKRRPSSSRSPKTTKKRRKKRAPKTGSSRARPRRRAAPKKRIRIEEYTHTVDPVTRRVRVKKRRMVQQELPKTGVGKPKPGRYVVSVEPDHEYIRLDPFTQASVTVQRELVKCGKANCKRCKKGPGHGPYFYAYWKDSGRSRSLYIGKKRRPTIEVLEARKAKNKGIES